MQWSIHILLMVTLFGVSVQKSRIQKLVNIQQTIVRVMIFKSYSEHTEPIFNYLKILNLQKLNEYLTSSFTFRYFHLHSLPEIFTDYVNMLIFKSMLTTMKTST